MAPILQILGFRRLIDQYIVHQIYLEFLDMIELLFSKEKLPTCLFSIEKGFIFYRFLLSTLKGNQCILNWSRPSRLLMWKQTGKREHIIGYKEQTENKSIIKKRIRFIFLTLLGCMVYVDTDVSIYCHWRILSF